ncbi:MAG: glycine--tRNA ligase subunit beta, partial [Asticcacaulis sp.]
FLSLPPEVIKTSMRTHQKYFAVRGSDGKMAPHFVITANTRAIDGGAEIKRGNAKVLSARLSDGVFFWNEDNREGNFDAWLEKLNGVTFHAKLGTMKQRVERITALAGHLAGLIGADVELTTKAARLAKADLASHMVMEFPELQGVMGGYYAEALGLDLEIANAIREHYKPQGPNDSVPTSKVSATVALADKIDTLVGFFAIDEKPTGSKDPYALRRSALGILRIIREQGERIAIGEFIEAWYNLASLNVGFLGQSDVPDPTFDADNKYLKGRICSLKELRFHVLAFFTDRLKVQLREEGRPLDVIEAVLSQADDDIVRLIAKIEALEAIKGTPQGEDLLALHKRASNILAAAKDFTPSGAPLKLAGAPEVEVALIAQLAAVEPIVAEQVRIENYQSALLSIAALRQGVDAFLDGVLVNAEDQAVRTNRLNLLARICDLSLGIADLARMA